MTCRNIDNKLRSIDNENKQDIQRDCSVKNNLEEGHC